MSDLISRQEALEALWKALYEYDDKTEKQFQESEYLDVGDWIEYRNFVQNMNDIDRQTIRNLPSAQPELITVNIDHELTQEEYEKLRKDMANAPIMLLPSAQRWIPCSERLPENEDLYLVMLNTSNLYDNEKQVTDAYWINNQWQYGVLESYEHRMPKLVIEPIEELKVIAWMPLHEPYKGEKS